MTYPQDTHSELQLIKERQQKLRDEDIKPISAWWYLIYVAGLIAVGILMFC